MTAEEARRKTVLNKNLLAEQQFQRCMEGIEKAVSQGKYHAELYDEGSFYTSTIERLKDLGYELRGCIIKWEVKNP